ncbi:Lon protease [Chloropicon primus]|uniref:Lon protease homolog n=1 Tax=Chloropicon primus TaxID=1764295 RepID=A0A5B8MJZ4_9CHLO|nr:Lon protease [Chloropicon primus]|eukprot:QDZ20796.1 Lon protease [Chloropicon primus]
MISAIEDATEAVAVAEGAGGLEASQKGGNALVPTHQGAALRQLVVVPLRSQPLLPGILLPVVVRDPKTLEAIREMKDRGQAYVGTFFHRNDDVSPLAQDQENLSDASLEDRDFELSESLDELHEVGSLAQVHQVTEGFEGSGHVLLMAHRRVRRIDTVSRNPNTVVVEHLKDMDYDRDDDIIRATTMEVVQCIKQLLLVSPIYKEQVQYLSRNNYYIHDPSRIADLGATLCSVEGKDIQDILEELDVKKRLDKTLLLLKKEVELNKIQTKISKQVEDTINEKQRKYFLMEQLKSIKKELGMEKDDKSALTSKFQELLDSFRSDAPENIVKVIEEELQKLSDLQSASPEFNVTRTYLDWLTSIPWGKFSEDKLDVEFAKEVLDEDHFGLDDVKERILEFIAVATLKGMAQGKILCLVGPPGVGKTSIGKSIARALGRKYYRFSVGGLSDVAEVKGHRRTYIGAMPGKLVQCLKTSGTGNPLVLIDEIDKLGRGVSGDPASALLELLDPEQNSGFVDHYLDVPLDLSKVLFVCTANTLDTIPAPLLDRMEIIRISGYISSEKFAIAKTYLEPDAVEMTGMPKDSSEISDGAMHKLIDEYCRESGVRNLKNHIEKVYRKLALELVRQNVHKGSEVEKIVVEEEDLSKYVGPPAFTTERIWEQTPIGVIMGLAWTSMGGSTLYVEASVVEKGEGKGSITTTGSLGDVMKESALIAYACAKDCLLQMDPENDFFQTNRIHIHVPAGATPKDGPSAGCTMITALLSLALGRSAVPDLAMTGEVTLTGRILPVGGIKEKVIAARRSGVKTIILPKENLKDVAELAEEVKEGLDINYVETYQQVLDIAFPK